MTGESSLPQDPSEDAAPFGHELGIHGSEVYPHKPDVITYGMFIRNGQIINFAERATLTIDDIDASAADAEAVQRGFRPEPTTEDLMRHVEQNGSWFMIPGLVSDKVESGDSPQARLLEKYVEPVPELGLARSFFAAVRRRRQIKRLPPSLRPRNYPGAID